LARGAEYDDVVRCLSDEDERSSCDDLSYSEAGIGLNGNSAHPAVLVMAPWNRTLSLRTALPLIGIPYLVTVNLMRVALWHEPSVCRLSVTSGSALTCSLTAQKNSRFADDIGELYEKIEFRGGKLIYLLYLQWGFHIFRFLFFLFLFFLLDFGFPFSVSLSSISLFPYKVQRMAPFLMTLNNP